MSRAQEIAVRAAIRGLVQGVAYRAWTTREAERRGLAGWVRNRPDGSVEAVFRGAPDEVTAMVEACQRGPVGARVDAVETATVDPAEVGEGGFAQIATG